MSSRLHGYVQRHAAMHPDDVAVVLGDRKLTYRELDDLSDRLAHRLTEVGRPGDRVCLLTSKTPEAIVGIIATLKAGRVYVPIDVASPVARIARIVRAAAPAWVLIDDAGSAPSLELRALGALEGSTTCRIEDWHEGQPQGSTPGWTTHPSEPVRVRGSRSDPAYIMFTSGSTGDPKGVVITHDNVIRFVEWAVSYFGIGRSDRNSGHPPLHFDLSVLDIFGTFAAGAQLHLIPAELNLVPDRLLDLIRASELTQWFSVPTTLTYIAKYGRMTDPDLPSLRRVLSCGEVLPTTTLIYWMERVAQASFTNLYGPTETTIASSYHTIPARPRDPGEPVPIGRPCDGEELLVLDEDLRRVPSGSPGELYIGGVGLGRGYWMDPEKTRSAFVAHPFSPNPDDRLYRTGDIAVADADGIHRFVGRTDAQIKSRGYRIELGEIESALRSLDVLNECAVVGVPTDGFEGTAICCAYATARGVEIEPGALRRQLTTLLPSYMLPTRWRILTELPTNVNGKIDRRELRRLFESELR